MIQLFRLEQADEQHEEAQKTVELLKAAYQKEHELKEENQLLMREIENLETYLRGLEGIDKATNETLEMQLFNINKRNKLFVERMEAVRSENYFNNLVALAKSYRGIRAMDDFHWIQEEIQATAQHETSYAGLKKRLFEFLTGMDEVVVVLESDTEVLKRIIVDFIKESKSKNLLLRDTISTEQEEQQPDERTPKLQPKEPAEKPKSQGLDRSHSATRGGRKVYDPASGSLNATKTQMDPKNVVQPYKSMLDPIINNSPKKK